MQFRQYTVNAVTLARIVCAAVIFIAARGEHWPVVFGVSLLAFISDWVDGFLARRWHAVSGFGMFFDPLADKIVCLSLLWLIAFQQDYTFYWVTAGLITVYDITTVSLRLINVKKRSLPASRTAKLKTALLMLGLLSALMGIMGESARWGRAGVYGSFVLLGTAAVLTFFSLSGYLRILFKTKKTSRLEKPSSLTEIDFTAWHNTHGIAYVLFDVEGTLTPWAEHLVEQETMDALARAKAAGIKEFGLVSNMNSRHKRRLQSVARQIGAKTYQLPIQTHERKPSPYMIRTALADLGAKPANTGFVGDKLVDVITAKRAGLARTAWVKRWGTADHILDKLVYRPLEPLLKRLVR